jgi:hypothetical protein
VTVCLHETGRVTEFGLYDPIRSFGHTSDSLKIRFSCKPALTGLSNVDALAYSALTQSFSLAPHKNAVRSPVQEDGG